jgi:CheY-like chemotaxis protein
MNGIIGMTQLLQITNLDSEQREYTDIIIYSARALLDIINDILDFSKIESGKMELEKTDFSVCKLVDQVCELFQADAQAKSLNLVRHIDPNLPTLLLGDPTRLRQVMCNLIGNALKFTMHGEVKVSVSCQPIEKNTARLFFSVTDTGIGMSAEVIERLFSPFIQGDASTTRKFGGTGLGLSISKRLVQLMGGDNLDIQSVEGQGSTFSFSLPFELVEAPELPIVENSVNLLQSDDTPPCGQILVVEDNPTNSKVISAMLTKRGFSIKLVENGQEAVDFITRGGSASLILMDCQMPIMDGFEATKCIRMWEFVNKAPRLPIVALTAGAFEDDRQRCSDAGMDDFLTKPVELANVLKVIALHTKKRHVNSDTP